MCMTLGYFFTNNVLIIPYLREFEKSGTFSFASFSPVENFQSNFQSVRSTGTYHEKLLSIELTMRVFLVERAHHGFFC